MNQIKGNMVIEAARRCILKQYINDATSLFYIFRTDTNQILARDIIGYEKAKEVSNQLRRQYKLKWEQVSFKKQQNLQKQKPQKSFDRARYLRSDPKYANPQRDRYSLSGTGGSRAYTHYKDWDE